MNREDLELLRSTARDLVNKHAEKLKSPEKEGLPAGVMKDLVESGMLASRLPSSVGGGDLPEEGYLAILYELSKASPSLATHVMIVNSIFYELVKKVENSHELLGLIASGKSSPAVGYSSIMSMPSQTEGLHILEKRVTGKEDQVLNSNCDCGVFMADGHLVLVRDGITGESVGERLGFNALDLSTLSIDSGDYSMIDENGKTALETTLDSIDTAVASIALGISDAALAIATNYATQRKAFDHELKDYKTLSSKIASLSFESKYLSGLIQSEGMLSEGEKLALKTRALSLAEEATNVSLQTHGGYGYYEDFQVERYYRDIIALESMFVRKGKDQERISGILFGERSGFL